MISPQGTDAISSRLGTLERQLRSARLVAGACVCGTIASIVLGLVPVNQTPPKEPAPVVELPILEVGGIVLKDPTGKKCATLGFNPRNQSPGLYLFNKHGNVVGEFSVSDGRIPELLLKNDEGDWRYMLSLGFDVNTPTQQFLWSRDHTGVTLLSMGIGAGVKPFLHMEDRQGQVLFEK